jgi:hypothetical protein
MTVRRHAERYALPLETALDALGANWRPHRIVAIEFADGKQAAHRRMAPRARHRTAPKL